MTFTRLVSEVEKEYDRISTSAESLSAEQLDRKAHVPTLKYTPSGECPALQAFVVGLGMFPV
jgi:hypothetical protein